VSIATPADTVSGMREIESIDDLDVVLKEETGSWPVFGYRVWT
jgi:hypothetical protein